MITTTSTHSLLYRGQEYQFRVVDRHDAKATCRVCCMDTVGGYFTDFSHRYPLTTGRRIWTCMVRKGAKVL
jgi:hypothetical protein